MYEIQYKKHKNSKIYKYVQEKEYKKKVKTLIT